MSNPEDLDKKIDAFEARMDEKIAELEARQEELTKENQEKIEQIKSLKDSINRDNN
jgi:hypothetical protein